MIQSGFLSEEDRKALTALARDGSSPCRVTRRANALVLLDQGMSCQEVAHVLLYDDDTIRGWRKLFEQRGIEGITSFNVGGSASYLSVKQEDYLKAWVGAALPRSTRQIGAWIEKEFGLVYESRSGLIALLHRLGLEYHKPNVIPRKLDEEKQKAFIASYEKLLNSLGDDEAVLFADAVHPTHAARPVGCWAPSQDKLAIEQTSGRQRINIHGAIDLATGQTRMIEVVTVNAVSTIRLLQSIEALYPMLALIHVFLDNARYHHAKLVQEWLARPECRIKLHFIPSYCPHLNPIERLWGLMHRNVTHNKCYATCAQFADATLGFLRETVPVAAGKAANLVGESPMPLIARFKRLAYPMRGEVTNRAVLGRKRHGRLRHLSGRRTVGTIWVAANLEARRLSNDCSRVIHAVQKSLNGVSWFSRPSGIVGKADVTGEETSKRTLLATVVGVRASEKRFAEITPGRA